MLSNRLNSSTPGIFPLILTILILNPFLNADTESCPFKITLIEKVKLEDQPVFIETPGSFIRTEDGLFIITDFKAGHLKIYEPSGALLKVFGRKGRGPGEFLSPLHLSYAHPYFAVADIDRRMVFIYTIDSEGHIEEKDYVKYPGGADGLSVSARDVLVSGYYMGNDNKPYSIARFDYSAKTITSILSRHEIFGYSSLEEYRRHFADEVAPLGMRVYLDHSQENLFAVWKADLRIIKKNMETGESHIFGEKTASYVQPEYTKAMKKAKQQGDVRQIQKENDRYSYIRNLTVTDDMLYLVYPSKGKRKIVQFYRHSGDFLGETAMPLPGIRGMVYFSRDGRRIYEFGAAGPDLKDGYEIRVFEIEQQE
jgi:hypothetical protein